MQLKRLMALTMSIALALASSPFVNVAAQVANPGVPSQQTVQATGLTISGTLLKSDRKTPIADGCVRLRKIDTSAIVGRTVSDRTGAYSFLVSEPGMYLVEVVDCDDDRRSGGERGSHPGSVTAHSARGGPRYGGGGFLIEHGLPRDCRRLRRRHHRHRRRRPGPPTKRIEPGAIARV